MGSTTSCSSVGRTSAPVTDAVCRSGESVEDTNATSRASVEAP